MTAGLPGWENLLGTLGPGRITIPAAATPNEAAVGRTLDELARERGADPTETALDLLLESHLDVTMVLQYAGEEAVREIAAHPLQLVGSDGIFGPHPHPRLWGTAARFSSGDTRSETASCPSTEPVARLVPLCCPPRPVRPGADRIGLRADLVLLDPERFVDTAAYDDPCRPEGVVGVWVAGERVWRDGAPTGARPGGVVRR